MLSFVNADSSPSFNTCRYKFDHKESYSLSDILGCHGDKTWTDTLVWIVRKSGPPADQSDPEALVFECLGGEVEARAVQSRHAHF